MSVQAPPKEIVIELNRVLKGIQMGLEAFESLQKKTKDNSLKQIFLQVQATYLMHSNILKERIDQLGGIPKEQVGLIGTLSQIYENIKNLTVDSDEEVLNEAYKACKTGFTMGDRFIEDNNNLDSTSREIIEKIVQDNKDLAQIFLNKISQSRF
jgi:bacterioferritin